MEQAVAKLRELLHRPLQVVVLDDVVEAAGFLELTPG